MKHTQYLILPLLLLLAVACKKNLTHGGGGIYADPKSLFSEINANFDLSHFDTALLITGLDSVLASKGPYTVFVVQDDDYPTLGFDLSLGTTYATGGSFYLPTGGPQSVQNYYYYTVQLGVPTYLRQLTEYHILRGSLHIADIPFAMNTGYATLDGDSVYISKYINPNAGDTVVTVNGIRVVRSDLAASNGTYHVLNQLLFPAPNRSVWDILSGSGALGWAFEPVPNINSNGQDTDGVGIPLYQFGLFTTALVRTGLDQVLKTDGPYTVLAVPDQSFINAYATFAQNYTLDQISNLNIDTLTRMMKQHILKGRYFLSDFNSFAYDGSILDTVYNPAFGTYAYSAPLGFPTLGGDTLYVIPRGIPIGPLGSVDTGLWVFGQGNVRYSLYTSLYQNHFAPLGAQDFRNKYFNNTYPTYSLQGLLPQDLVAPNGVVQFLSNNELVPQ